MDITTAELVERYGSPEDKKLWKLRGRKDRRFKAGIRPADQNELYAMRVRLLKAAGLYPH